MREFARPSFRALARIAARLRADRTQFLACALGITGAVLVAQTRSPSLMLAGMFGVYEVTALVGLANTAGLVL